MKPSMKCKKGMRHYFGREKDIGPICLYCGRGRYALYGK